MRMLLLRVPAAVEEEEEEAVARAIIRVAASTSCNVSQL